MSHLILKGALRLETIQEEGKFCGYASVFDHVDQQQDRVMCGAFERSLRKNTDAPKMLWQHNASEPIGVWEVIKEDARGLYVEGKLLLDLQKGREAYTLLKKGVVTGLSIGCHVVEAHFCPKEQVRNLTQVDLKEISLVTFAANEEAKVHAVKAKDWMKAYRERLEASMRNAIRVLQEI